MRAVNISKNRVISHESYFMDVPYFLFSYCLHPLRDTLSWGRYTETLE